MKTIKSYTLTALILAAFNIAQAQIVIPTDVFNAMWEAAEEDNFTDGHKIQLEGDIELANHFNRSLLANGHFDWFTLGKAGENGDNTKKLAMANVQDWSVYPNPTNGENTSVAFNLDEELFVNIYLTNLLGANVRSFYQASFKGEQRLDLNLSGLNKGIYFLVLESDKKEIALKQKLVID